MQSTKQEHVVNYYTVLGLPYPQYGQTNQIPKDDLKAAYHKALLIHHPDKAAKTVAASSKILNTDSSSEKYSIDEIMRAYQVLTQPALKAQYDNHLLPHRKWPDSINDKATGSTIHLGVEKYDLEDLEYDETNGCWSAPCRCGDTNGYTLTESELEKESEYGEIYVGCQGCSLFIKVLFTLVHEQPDR